MKVERIRSAIERWDERFLRRVFTDYEISHCLSHKIPYESFAVRFAAKEALIKAVGTRAGSAMTDLEITNSASGKPSISVNGMLKEHFSANGITLADVSLSHEREYAVASVVLER